MTPEEERELKSLVWAAFAVKKNEEKFRFVCGLIEEWNIRRPYVRYLEEALVRAREEAESAGDVVDDPEDWGEDPEGPVG